VIRDYHDGDGAVELQEISAVSSKEDENWNLSKPSSLSANERSPSRSVRFQNMNQLYDFDRVESVRRRKQKSLYDYGGSLRSIRSGEWT